MLHRNRYQLKDGQNVSGDALSSKHRTFKKNFETELKVDATRLHLNHFMQETIANMMIGFVKTLKQAEEEAPASMEIRIRKLPKQVEVDAHTYP